MQGDWFTSKWPVAALTLLLALGALVAKDLGERLARWIADHIVVTLSVWGDRISEGATRCRARLRRLIFRQGGRWSHRQTPSLAKVLIRAIAWMMRYLAGELEDANSQKRLSDAVDEVVSAGESRGPRGAIATGVGGVLGVIQRRAAKDRTVLVALLFGSVAVILIAIGIQEMRLGLRFGVPALVIGILLLGLGHVLVNRQRAGIATASLGLIGPAGVMAALTSPTMITRVGMLIGATFAGVGTAATLWARKGGLVVGGSRNATASSPAFRAVGVAVRCCSASTLIFSFTNVVQALHAATRLLQASYAVNALLLLAIVATTIKEQDPSAYPGLLA